MLVALVDLGAHGGRAVVGRDDDDPVGGGTRWEDVDDDRLGQPARDGGLRVWIGRSDERADGLNRVEGWAM